MLAGILARPGIKAGLGIAKWLLPAIAIAVLAARLYMVDRDRDAYRDWQGQIVAAVRAEVPVKRRKAVTAATATDEIQWLGREFRTVAKALEIQSGRLVVAAGKAKAAQDGAAAARKRAKERGRDDQALRTRLTDPKRSSGLTAQEWSRL